MKNMINNIKGEIQIAFYLAYSDTRARYSRSLLGPLWLVFGTLIGVWGLGLIWSNFFGIERKDFIPQLTMGYILWFYISGVISDSSGLYIRNNALIKNTPTLLWRLNFELLLRHFINLIHNLLVLLIVLLTYNSEIDWVMLSSLVGFLVLSIALFFVSIIISILGARYKDIEPLISAVMPIIFFLSPIIISTKQQVLATYFKFNPITHYLAIVRDPFFMSLPSLESVITCATLTLIITIAAVYLYSMNSDEVAYWV
jgi:ABC-type polysaccharide/polyol phosphate export permease